MDKLPDWLRGPIILACETALGAAACAVIAVLVWAVMKLVGQLLHG